MPIISLIFSKTGMYSILAISLLSFGAYVTNIWNSKTELILVQKNKIDQYKVNEKELRVAISNTKDKAKFQTEVLNTYTEQVSELEQTNAKLTKGIFEAKAKIQARDMEALKRSSHAELVLSIINKSIVRQSKEFNTK